MVAAMTPSLRTSPPPVSQNVDPGDPSPARSVPGGATWPPRGAVVETMDQLRATELSVRFYAGRRHVERDPAEGWVTRITIEGEDERGRTLHAVGTRLSGIIINRHSFIDSNGLIEWTINGHAGHGEDQDMWPVHAWAAMRRSSRG